MSGAVILIVLLGFELPQASRLASHCAEEETETQNMLKSCLKPQGQSLDTLTPRPVPSFPCTHFFPCPCGSGPALFDSPWLQAGAGDGLPPGGGIPGGRLKFLQWPVARVHVLHPFLQPWPSRPARGRKEWSSCTCPRWGPGTDVWLLATSLWRVDRQAAPENVCISQSPSRKQMARSSGII